MLIADAASTWSPGPLYIALEPFILTAFGVVFSALLAWAISIFQQRTGIQVSDSAKADLQQSAMNAAGRVLANMEGPITNAKIDVHSQAVADELPKLLVNAGDAITKLGLTPDRVANLLVGKIGQLQASAPTTPVVVVPPVTETPK